MSKADQPADEWDPSTYTVQDLAGDLGYSYRALTRLASHIGARGYSQFVKRNARKARVIAMPAPWLMRIQRTLVDVVFPRLPISQRVFSQRGRDVVQNAREHVGHTHMVVMDIRDCFPSVTLGMIRTAFTGAGLSRDVAGLLSRLVTHNGRLPQGPPTSSAVLDFVFSELDDELAKLAAANSAVYSRYADDICFSSASPLGPLRRRAKRALSHRGFRLNNRKTTTWGPSDTKIVTNIVVSDSLHADPKYLKLLDASIRTFGTARATQSEASIIGQINWVRRLNGLEGDRYQRRFQALKAKRLANR